MKIPHVFVLLVGVIFGCTILTYIIPSGEYKREQKTIGSLQRTVVLAGTYESEEKEYSLKGILFGGEHAEGKATPVSFTQFLSAVPRGMQKSADIIFFVFIIGGVLGILQRTGTVTAAIHKLIDTIGHRANLLTIVLMLILAIGGSTLGMGEEFIPLIPIFLMISKELGYDRVYGLGIVVLSGHIGFAAATTNPFTVNIAQGIAELPLNSDIPFRLVFLAVCLTFSVGYLLRYGARIRRDPSKSIMADDDFDISHQQVEKEEMTKRHWLIIICSTLIFVFIMYAIQTLDWWLAEMAGGFMLMGMVAKYLSGLSWNDTTKAFVKGMEEMVVAALVVGFARGIQVVLDDGKIMDTAIFYAASFLRNFHSVFAAEGMFAFQTLLNVLIPSGSGQAAVTMPLMSPLADVLGLSRQTAVFAFTCGDGFSNTIIPTSGLLMAYLSLAGIPYTRWLRFMVPAFVLLSLIAGVFLMITVLFPSVWVW